jgi:hypothetical protein
MVSVVTSTLRTITPMSRTIRNVFTREIEATNLSGPMELDSHADTCCAGSNCCVIEYTGKVCNVVGFNHDTPNDELKGVPIVKAATAYDALTGEMYKIILSQSLYLGDLLSYSLLCPNQL